jgi:hypothetical protein
MSIFKRATKLEAKLRLAIIGPSGSGKTYSALAIATTMGGPVAVIDTENGSASKYADIYEFDVAEMHAPYTVDKYIAAIQEAQSSGYKTVILDSLSQAWAGTGGVLDYVDTVAKRSKSGNTYMAWKEGTPVHNALIDAIVSSDIHVIGTMRSKTEYVLDETSKGTKAPRKVGMAPIQRDGMEYEFDIVLDMDMDNNAIVQKSRCSIMSGKVYAKPGSDVADILTQWLSGAPKQPEPTKQSQHTAQPAKVAQRPAIAATAQSDASIEQDCSKFITWARNRRTVGGPATEKQYQYLAGTVDAITGRDDHKAVFELLFGAAIDHTNPPSKAITSDLLDALLPERTDFETGEKTPNPDYKPQAVVCVRRLSDTASRQEALL